MSRRKLSDIERFMQYIEPITESGCWIWMASDDGKGYGQFSIKGKPCKAHHFAYEYFKGPLPLGLMPDHLCRVRLCANPDHLEAVTNKVNVLRGNGHTARNARKIACNRGHLFGLENTYFYKGKRYCKACQRENWPKYHLVEKREP